MLCGCRADWGDFLHIRHLLIAAWLDEGTSPAEIAAALSMDPKQVLLIGMTPFSDTHAHLSGGSRDEA